MKVKNDEEAILLMNDSQYGLTASIWTVDTAVSMAIGDRLDVGTIFQNRCDYLDPGLPWTGVKNSGRGSTLSHLGFFWLIVGFDQLTRPKGYHLRVSQ
jgi:acyl-CoA reductase-like NAD-dependent aldehyde dehydrogenase